MAQSSVESGRSRALVVIAATLLAVVVIAVLYIAAEILIPIALAIFFSFLLSPVVSYLQRKGLGRVASVLLVTFTSGIIIVGLSYVVSRQIAGLVKDLPSYTPNIRAKVRSLRAAGLGNGGATEFEKMYEEIAAELNSPLPGADPEVAIVKTARPTAATEVMVRTNVPPWVAYVGALVPPLLAVIAQAGLAGILVLFMLLKREDLRNRFIRVAGKGQLTVTTRAVDDAARRISKFLLLQLVVNSAFGLVLTAGLWAIDVKYSLLWGVIGTVMRYIPYLGTWLGLIFPLALSLFTSTSWTQPLLLLGLYVSLELLSNNFLEPYLFGSNVGVSEVGLLVMAAIWTFLWGPIGLMLSTPLTVCLVVLGKYVPSLEVFDVLLGDRPPLDPHVTYYQRLLARDQDEASDIVQKFVKENSQGEVYDQLLVPSLCFAKRDRERDDLSDEDEAFVLATTRSVMADVGPVPEEKARPTDASNEGPLKVLALATRDEMDEAALHLFRQFAELSAEDMEIGPSDMLAGEQLDLVAKRQPGIVCVASLPPGGLSHARYMCKRLRARFPDAKILVGRWGLKGNLEENERQLTEAGADHVGTTMADSRSNLRGWLTVVEPEREPVKKPARPSERTTPAKAKLK